VANTNIQEVRDRFPNLFIFTGLFTDFSPSWYNTVGVTILFSMLLFAFTSQISYFLLKLTDIFLRCIDSGCSCDGSSTKKLTKNEYFGVYIGPVFDIGTRYSEVKLIFILLDSICYFHWTCVCSWNASTLLCNFFILLYYVLD